MDKLLKLWPIAMAAFFIVSAVVTAQLQIKSQADSIKELKTFVTSTIPTMLQIQLNQREIEDLSEGLDDAEEWLGELQWSVNELEKR